MENIALASNSDSDSDSASDDSESDVSTEEELVSEAEYNREFAEMLRFKHLYEESQA